MNIREKRKRFPSRGISEREHEGFDTCFLTSMFYIDVAVQSRVSWMVRPTPDLRQRNCMSWQKTGPIQFGTKNNFGKNGSSLSDEETFLDQLNEILYKRNTCFIKLFVSIITYSIIVFAYHAGLRRNRMVLSFMIYMIHLTSE